VTARAGSSRFIEYGPAGSTAACAARLLSLPVSNAHVTRSTKRRSILINRVRVQAPSCVDARAIWPGGNDAPAGRAWRRVAASHRALTRRDRRGRDRDHAELLVGELQHVPFVARATKSSTTARRRTLSSSRIVKNNFRCLTGSGNVLAIFVHSTCGLLGRFWPRKSCMGLPSRIVGIRPSSRVCTVALAARSLSRPALIARLPVTDDVY
jgi:hypothetical protein